MKTIFTLTLVVLLSGCAAVNTVREHTATPLLIYDVVRIVR